MKVWCPHKAKGVKRLYDWLKNYFITHTHTPPYPFFQGHGIVVVVFPCICPVYYIANTLQNQYIVNRFCSKSMTSSVQFSSVTQSCLTLFDPTNRSTAGLPVHHQLLEFTQTHIHRVGDAIQPCYPLSSPSPPTPNPSQHQSLFQWVNSSHEVDKVLEFQL